MGDELEQLRTLTPEDGDRQLPETVTARAEILRPERFRTAIAKGNKCYARDDYRQARAIWNRGRNLAPPDSEYSEKLARVERVLDKLKNLETRDD